MQPRVSTSGLEHGGCSESQQEWQCATTPTDLRTTVGYSSVGFNGASLQLSSRSSSGGDARGGMGVFHDDGQGGGGGDSTYYSDHVGGVLSSTVDEAVEQRGLSPLPQQQPPQPPEQLRMQQQGQREEQGHYDDELPLPPHSEGLSHLWQQQPASGESIYSAAAFYSVAPAPFAEGSDSVSILNTGNTTPPVATTTSSPASSDIAATSLTALQLPPLDTADEVGAAASDAGSVLGRAAQSECNHPSPALEEVEEEVARQEEGEAWREVDDARSSSTSPQLCPLADAMTEPLFTEDSISSLVSATEEAALDEDIQGRVVEAATATTPELMCLPARVL